MFGGHDGWGRDTDKHSSVERFDAVNGCWVECPSMSWEKSWCLAGVLGMIVFDVLQPFLMTIFTLSAVMMKIIL